MLCVIIYIRNKTCFAGNIQLNPLAKKKHPIESWTHAPLIFNVWDLREWMKLRRFDPWSLILCYGQKWIRITGQSLIKFSQMVTHKTSCCFILVEPCPVLVCGWREVWCLIRYTITPCHLGPKPKIIRTHNKWSD